MSRTERTAGVEISIYDTSAVQKGSLINLHLKSHVRRFWELSVVSFIVLFGLYLNRD